MSKRDFSPIHPGEVLREEFLQLLASHYLQHLTLKFLRVLKITLPLTPMTFARPSLRAPRLFLLVTRPTQPAQLLRVK